MRALPVAELKARFSKVLADVRRRERIGVLYEPEPAGRRELGFLDGEVTIEFADDFEMTEEEFLSSA